MSDPYWRDTRLILRGESGGIVDKKGYALTVIGNAATATSPLPPLSDVTHSIVFDGAGDYVLLTNSQASIGGVSACTIEMWAYFTAIGTADSGLYYTGSTGSNFDRVYLAALTNGSVVFRSEGGSGVVEEIVTAAGTVTNGVWYHIGVSVNNRRAMLFIDGVSSGSVLVNRTVISNENAYIGYGYVGGAAKYHSGNLAEVRITMRVGRLTDAFTRPGAQYPTTGAVISGTARDADGVLGRKIVRAASHSSGALLGQTMSDATTGEFSIPVFGSDAVCVTEHDLSGQGDLFWSNVVLSTPFDTYGMHDLKGNLLTVTGATISTAQSKFAGGASAYFSGSSQRVQTTCDLSGNADFTIELFAYLINGGHGNAYSRILHLGTGNTLGALNLVCLGSAATTAVRASIWAPTETVIGDTATLNNNQWYHFCIERVYNQWSFYLDGALVGTTYKGCNLVQTQLNIGANTSLAEAFHGHMNSLRVTKIVARYNGACTVPTVAYPAEGVSIGTANADIYDFVVPV